MKDWECIALVVFSKLFCAKQQNCSAQFRPSYLLSLDSLELLFMNLCSLSVRLDKTLSENSDFVFIVSE